MARAHQRFLPLLGQRLPSAADAPPPVSDVLLTASATQVLRNLLELPVVRIRLLFGHRTAAHLRVTHVTTGGHEGGVPLFTVNPHSALGVTEALRQTDAGFDWVGHWLTVPGDAFAGERQRWIELAQGAGLISDLHPLVLVGWRGGVLTAHSLVLSDGPGEVGVARTRVEVGDP